MKWLTLIVFVFFIDTLNIQAQNSIDIEITAGTLSSVLSDNLMDITTDLTLSGTMDARDFQTIKGMPLLTNLDLTEVDILEYTGTEGTKWGAAPNTYLADIIPFGAFSSMENLKSVLLPESIVSIDEAAFYYCTKLTYVAIPATVTSIGAGCFYLCQSLEEITLPPSLTFIADSIFIATALKSITFPSAITRIGEAAFSDCNALKTLNLPSSVDKIEFGAFFNCTGLETITVNNSNPFVFGIYDDYVFYGVNLAGCKLYVPCGSGDDYSVADQWKDFENIIEFGCSFDVICPPDYIIVETNPGSCDAYVAIDIPAINCQGCSNITITNDYNNSSDASDYYPIGTTTVTFTITDSTDNFKFCSTTITVVNSTPPTIVCPPDVAGIMDASDCFALPPLIEDPVYSSECFPVHYLDLTFQIEGAWDTTGIGSVSAFEFPVGISTVTYFVTDPDGNFDQCSFTVSMLRNEIPNNVISCPSEYVVVMEDACDAFVNLETPTINENCETADYTITNDYNGTSDASDFYWVGITTVTWTITDNSGNDTTCTVYVEVIPMIPTLICPSDIVVASDYNETFASGVELPEPFVESGCPAFDLTWTMTGATAGSGIYVTPSSFTFNIGVTVVTYTVIDLFGNIATCNFTVTVTGPPLIECPSDTVMYSDTSCDQLLDPGIANLIEGFSPMTWTFKITNPDGATGLTGTYFKNEFENPDSIGDYTFHAGTSIVTWQVENLSGYDECSHEVIVMDTIPPAIICHDTVISSSSDIFSPFQLDGILMNDNCGIDTIILLEEYYSYPENTDISFCPDTVFRIYKAYDHSGNSSTCTQTIGIENSDECKTCQDSVPYFLVNMNGTPDSLWILDNNSVVREGACCRQSDGSAIWDCISFNIYLDEDAVGLVFDVTNPSPPGVEYFQIDCGGLIPLGEPVCLQGGRYYTLTFCRPGEDRPIYSIQSIQGAITNKSLTTRADSDCFGNLFVNGLEPSTIAWSVAYPIGADSLIRYLDFSDSQNPVFTPDSLSPAMIKYEVCGIVSGISLCEGNPVTDCAEVIVNVLPPVTVHLNQDLTTICENEIPLIETTIPFEDPNLTYTFAWYNGPDGTGEVVSNSRNFQPLDAGTYSLLVNEVTTGIGCNSDLINFSILFDNEEPVLLVPPSNLFIKCNDPVQEQIIADWLATGIAYDKNNLNILVYNDFETSELICNTDIVVNFWAYDRCGNRSIDSSIIRVTNNAPPVATNDYYDVPCGNVSLKGNVILNDYETDGDYLIINPNPIISPRHGIIVLNDDGNFEYDPFDDFINGLDSFLYEVYDEPMSGLNLSDTAWVFITRVLDTDCDGVANVDDLDDDNDGIRDMFEGNAEIDSDLDDVPDSWDIDSDNDGILDYIEGQDEQNYIKPDGWRDNNNNGWDDRYDPEQGGFTFDLNLTDSEGDGIPDFRDTDSDDDHVPDLTEGNDKNADGIPDVSLFFSDLDRDGLDDAFDTFDGRAMSELTDNETGSNVTLQDTDGDGWRDWRDNNDDDDLVLTVNEDMNDDGNYSNDDLDQNGIPAYLDSLEYPTSVNTEFKKDNQIFNVYPNPMKDNLIVETSLNGVVVISDMNGKLVLRQVVEKGQTEINVSILATGVYSLGFESDVECKTLQLIKQ